MLETRFLSSSIAALALAVTLWPQNVQAQERSGVVRGSVKDASGASVAGAFVKLKNAERRLTFMVITQADGRYSADTLVPGMYVVQAVGTDHQSDSSAPVDVGAGRPATVDLSLTAVRAAPLAPAWPGMLPGQQGGEAEAATTAVSLPEGEGKAIAEAKCIACHDLQRTIRTRADRTRWEQIIGNMRLYAQGSTLAKDLTDAEAKVLLEYVVANFSGSRSGSGRPKPDPNSRLPRTLLQGDATRYVAVEFEPPNLNAEPHEVTVDADGNGWVTQRLGGRLGRLDLKTLLYSEMDVPAGDSKTNRLNGIVAEPGNKRLWFVDGGPNRRWLVLDAATREVTTYVLPRLKSGAASGNTMRVHPNGTVWLNSIAANQVIRLDPKTKAFTVYDVPAGVKAGRTANPYGMAISGDGKVWFIENAMNKLGRIDPATGKIDEFDIPVKDAVARKGGMDSSGNVWVGLHGAGKLMKVDYKTTQMTVFTPPTGNAGVYSVQGDPKSPLVWFSEQHVDKIARFDPQTETFTEFPLPSAESDPRRIEIDPNNPNRIWWSGTLSGKIGYVELLK